MGRPSVWAMWIMTGSEDQTSPCSICAMKLFVHLSPASSAWVMPAVASPTRARGMAIYRTVDRHALPWYYSGSDIEAVGDQEMRYTVIHSCGHMAEHKLTGPQRYREYKLRKLAEGLCPTCQAEERERQLAE